MTTTPEGPTPAPDDAAPEPAGAEIGVSEGEGSTFEPEEDPEGHGGASFPRADPEEGDAPTRVGSGPRPMRRPVRAAHP
jgi:hypothetical protein